MKMHARTLVAGMVALTLSIGSLAIGSRSEARDNDDVMADVDKLAELLQQGDADAAQKKAADIAKNRELEDVMNTMKLRTAKNKTKAFGYKDGAPSNQDGVEAKLIGLGKKADPKQAQQDSAHIAKLAYRVAAIATIAQIKAPEKDEGAKKKKDWLEWSKDMKDSAEELGKAAKSKNAAEIKKAAKKLNSSCNNCHGVFRD
jgi:hypothetical protein